MPDDEPAPGARLRIASWLLVAVALFTTAAPLVDILPKHAFDPTWSEHARFHVTLGAANLLGLSVVALLVARTALLRARRWSWFALLAYVILGPGVIPAIARLQGSGPPQPVYTVIVVAIVVGLAALGLAFGPVFLRRGDAG